MIGLILCGGQSARMGKDKGLLIKDSITWAQIASEKLTSLNIAVKFSVNRQQLMEYGKIFPIEDLITDNDSLSLKGPLLGVLSVNMRYPLDDLFIVACDLPLLQTKLLTTLMEHYQQSNEFEAFIFTNNKELEPLCGIYTAKGLKKIIELKKENKLLKHSMKFILENLLTKTIPINEANKKQFTNFNTNAQLEDL